MRILFASSPGGHLAQLAALRPWWRDHERLWVVAGPPESTSIISGERVRFGAYPTTRNLPNLVRNWRLARQLLSEFRPNVIVSAGAAIAVPFFAMAHRHHATSVYLEVVDRVASSTLTGRLVYPLADRFLVQWPEQESFYPGATVVGPVI